ncbi:MAG: gliding motility lipoprotein GldB [Cytophagales bacterium]|nr:gliding motility lipoprotein GldB [Cytophagales bacterium]
MVVFINIVFQKKPVFLFSVLVLLLSTILSCKKDKCIDAPDVSQIEVPVKLERLDLKLHKIPTKNELEALLDRNPMFTEAFLHRSQYPAPELLIDRLYNLFNSDGIDSLFIEVDLTFGDLEDIRLEFERAFRYLKYHFPDADVPKIQTVVTGIANDLYISDSLIIIGLDYYLGPEGKYQPRDIPAYLLKRYQKEYLVSQIMLMYTRFYNSTNYEDQTALADMIYYGKAYYMAKNLLPCTADSIFTGYTSFETNDIDEHEPVIWASLLENEVLYEKNPFIKDRFLSERPKTLEVGENCPGRIGRWVGWRIIDKYVEENPGIELADLMKMDDAQKIFIESKYKPIPY